MRVTFWHSDKPRERILADAFARGVSLHGDSVALRPLTPGIFIDKDCDVACMVGVKSRQLFRAHWDAGVHTIMFDKGYVRHQLETSGPKIWEFWRVAVDSHHPTQRLMRIARPADRFEALGLEVAKAWREPTKTRDGKAILIAGSSQKYHDFYGLWDPTRWTEKVVRNLREATRRRIIYRPKPSWSEAVAIEGTEWGGNFDGIDQALAQAEVLLTHGSNACFEAVLRGVPCVVLGDGVAKPISTTDLFQVEKPLRVEQSVRMQWLYNLAYYQWTLKEMASGECWNHIRPEIYG